MSSQLPAAIKAADLARFAMRASQLEKAKPVISYYCTFWIVNQILSKGLHNTDEECLVHTTSLMDKLEQFKADSGENDAVTDDLAGRAYVEQFGLETLQRADNAVRADKASRQTADTYQAAATFLELLQIWGEIDPENAAKIKYAKYHALRIAKALKAGQDPNASNPTPESQPADEDILPAPDPNDAEVQMPSGASSKPRQPSVVDVPDEAHRVQSDLAHQSSLDESLHPSRASSVPRPTVTVPRPKAEEIPDETYRLQSALAKQSSLDQSIHPPRAPSLPRPSQDEVSPVDASTSAEDFYQQSSHDDVSPLGPEPPTSGRKASIGGNYFPQAQVPAPQQPSGDDQPPFTLPSAPSDFTSPQPRAPNPPPSNHVNVNTTAAFSPFPPPPPPQTQQHPHFLPPPQNQPPRHPLHHHHHNQYPPQQHHHQQPPLPLPLPPQPCIPPNPPATGGGGGGGGGGVVDEEALALAQKHARWAISALNFEDVPTAIRELEGALGVLGAR